MWESGEVFFASDHPTASGHFPGHPIIPGALLLDEVVKIIITPVGDTGEIVIRSVKFLQPVRPGETIIVQWKTLKNGDVKFECRLPDGRGLAVVGVIELGLAPR